MTIRSWADGDVLPGSSYVIDRDAGLRWASRAFGYTWNLTENYSGTTAAVATNCNRKYLGYHATGTSLLLNTGSIDAGSLYSGRNLGPISAANQGAVHFFGYIGSRYDEFDSATINGSKWMTGGQTAYWAASSSNVTISGAAGSTIKLQTSGTDNSQLFDSSGINTGWSLYGYLKGRWSVNLLNNQGSVYTIEGDATPNGTLSGTFEVMLRQGRMYRYRNASLNGAGANEVFTEYIAPTINGPWYVQLVGSSQAAEVPIITIDWLRTNIQPLTGSLALLGFSTGSFHQATVAGMVYSGLPGWNVQAQYSGALTNQAAEIRAVQWTAWSDID